MEVQLNKLADILYPPACPLCGKVASIRDGKSLSVCLDCEEGLKYIGEDYCLKCGKELRSAEEQYCYDCSRMQHIYNQGAAVFVYTDAIKQSIYRFKYKGRREYAKWYGKMLAERCGFRIRMWSPDVIIPIPLHKYKLRARGYNQAELMARALAGYVGLPVDGNCITRVKNTAPMKKFDGEDRRKNLKNAFLIKDNVVKYKKVLLVDDIYTTGATVDACAAVLKEHGVEEVYSISLCVGKGI